MPIYKGKAVIDVTVVAASQEQADKKFLSDMNSSFNGVDKKVLVKPEFTSDIPEPKPEDFLYKKDPF